MRTAGHKKKSLAHLPMMAISAYRLAHTHTDTCRHMQNVILVGGIK